jgi:large subunit ribosomal protein L10
MRKEEKAKLCEELKETLKSHSVIGLIDMARMPTKQLQQIKKALKEKARIVVIKKSSLNLALKGSKVEVLQNLMPEQPALLLSNQDAFELYKEISKVKMPRFARGGDIAQKEIIVPAGPTALTPGPVISELSRVGIPAGVESGRISIKKDVMVAKAGDAISPELAGALKKLGIEAMETSLNVVAMWEGGTVYGKDVLELVTSYPEKLKEASMHALRLSLGIGYPTPQSIKYLLIKAHQHAKLLTNLKR